MTWHDTNDPGGLFEGPPHLDLVWENTLRPWEAHVENKNKLGQEEEEIRSTCLQKGRLLGTTTVSVRRCSWTPRSPGLTGAGALGLPGQLQDCRAAPTPSPPSTPTSTTVTCSGTRTPRTHPWLTPTASERGLVSHDHYAWNTGQLGRSDLLGLGDWPGLDLL